MTVPWDGFPTNLTAAVRAMLDEKWAGNVQPVLVLRRANCGCRLGAAYRLQAGRLLMGQRRSLVQATVATAKAHLQAFAVDLDAVDAADFSTGELACRHGGVVLDRAGIIKALGTATRLGSVHVL